MILRRPAAAYAVAAVLATLLAASAAVALFRSAAIAALQPAPADDRTLLLALLTQESGRIFWTTVLTVATAFALPAAVAWAARRRTRRSLHELTRGAAVAAQGDLASDLPLPEDDEAAELAAAINRMRRALTAKIEEVESDRRLVLSLISGMREGLVWVGPGRRVRMANDTFRQIFALPYDPTGHLLAEVVRNPSVMRELDLALTERGESREFTFHMIGSGRSFEAHVTPLTGRAGERSPGALILFFDVTRLEALERVRQDFVANVSHELRTPLTSIKAFVETLSDDGLEDREQSLKFLSIVRKHADRMGELIDDLTDLSLIETGAVALDQQELDAGEVARDVAAQLALKARAAGVEVAVEIPDPFPVRADRRRLVQILVNLIDNAIKFNRPGGRVVVGGGTEEGRPTLWVEDTGTGIPADSLEQVFHRFYRVDKARSKEIGGTGLGLAIVRHLMRLHGGQVVLASEIGRGSRFTLEFPPPPPP
ncbi:MAG TPA: ATP-binding protein [Candidatus Polarisedimenticolaceae bacterium]